MYNVTDYVDKHPGGKYILLKKNGFDITEDLEFHSANAKKLLAKFKIL